MALGMDPGSIIVRVTTGGQEGARPEKASARMSGLSKSL